ncbi:ABC transporter ATP-binding protein [Oceanobacillus sp. J11TS1]|uniref:ABC transporter ATP-binding protein n=1 Tax=Oceanobacillus sp. J11TS1 TaxID=2807191 RepID=UPI001B1F1865|nr:ABC transporter ATP-binding protein [Oceanobacillus sp. J11TS1]GIO22896.1 ABC transporter ATP-binding protein [Oceanobacillus sp. J11TS1]
MEKIVHFNNVTWRRNNQEILSEINWQIKEGEHWAILGLNGSGKTSLLNIITGYNYPTSGKMIVLDQLFGRTDIPELRKSIGYVSSALDRFQETIQLEPVENIIASGKFASFGIYEEVSESDWQLVDKILSDLRLEYLRGKKYSVLSQGERRRVLIGRALMSRPEILILDEPCSGLDILSREEVLELMEDLRKDTHLLYVTHHIEEITEAISHVALVRDGKLVATGKKEEVLTDNLLSETFKIPVQVHWDEGRPWLTIEKRK